MPREQVVEEPLEHEFDPELQRELLQHAGRWVATTRSELVAVGDSPREVHVAALAAGVDLPVIFRVRDDSGRAYFY